MKILHVNKFFDLRGGVETYLHGLIEHQRAAGHEVHVLSTRSPSNLPSPDASRFVERFNFDQREGAAKDLRKAVAFVWNREARRAMDEAIRDFHPDVIHLHNIYHHLSSSILASIRHSGIPCVQTLQDYKLACPNYKMLTEGEVCERCKGGHYLEAVKHHCLTAQLSGNLLAAFEMGLTKLTQSYERTVRLFLCASQFLADKMAAWGEPPSKLRLMTNPVEPSSNVATCDGTYLLFAGRLSEEKGIATIIRAVAEVPGLELKIAGTGPEEARLRSLVQELGTSQVTFLGFLRKAELAELRAHAKAMVVPSIWYEVAPFTILETMADSLPVIASRIGGLPELVHHEETGLLVDPGNVPAWTEAFIRIAHCSQSDLCAMGHKGRELAHARHNWTDHIATLTSYYKEAGATD